MFEAWRRHARNEVERVGHLATGWRASCTIAVIAMAAVSLVWLRDYLASGHLPLLPVIGAASLVTFVVATVGFPLAAVLWLLGRSTEARVAGLAALGGWFVTAILFQVLMGGSMALTDRVGAEQAGLLAWTLLAAMATIGVTQPRPPAPMVAGGVLLAAAAGALMFTRSGLLPTGDSSALYVAADASWLPAVLDRGSDTLHTTLLGAWGLLLLIGVVVARIDARPVLAAMWLVPFVLLSQLRALTLPVLVLGLLAAVAVPALGRASERLGAA